MDIELLHLASSAENCALPSKKAEATRLLNLAVTTQQQLYERGLCNPCYEGMAYTDSPRYLDLLADPDVQITLQETYFSGIRAIAVALQAAPDVAVPAYLALTNNHRGSREAMAGAGAYIDGLLQLGRISDVVEYVQQTNPWPSMGKVIDAVASQGNEQDKKKLTRIFDQAVAKRMPADRMNAYRLADRFAQINPQRALTWIQQAFNEAGATIPLTQNLLEASGAAVMQSLLVDETFDYIDRPARLEAAVSLAEGRLIAYFSGVPKLLIEGLKKERNDNENNNEVIEAKALALATVRGDDYTLADASNRHICRGLLKSIPLLVRQNPVDMKKINNIIFLARDRGLDDVLISKMIAQSLPTLIPQAMHRLDIYGYDFKQLIELVPALLDQQAMLSEEGKSTLYDRYYQGLRPMLSTKDAGLALKEIARYFPTTFEENYQLACKFRKDNQRVNASLGEYARWDAVTARRYIEQALASKELYSQAGAMEALVAYYPHDPDWTLTVIETSLVQRNHVYMKEKTRETLSRIVHNLVTELLTQ